MNQKMVEAEIQEAMNVAWAKFCRSMTTKPQVKGLEEQFRAWVEKYRATFEAGFALGLQFMLENRQ